MTSSIQSRLGTAPEEGCKAPCVTASVTNITLSGEQTINSVAVVAGNRVLVAGQTDLTQNGIYNVQTTAWTYAKDWNKANDVISGVIIPVTDSAQIYQAIFTGTFTAGTTSVTFTTNDASLTPKIYNSVASIRVLNLSGVPAVQTLGHGSAGDSGAALYRADLTDTTSSDDDYLVIISADGIRFKLVEEGYKNIKLAGAKGDGGVTDNQPLIQKVVNSTGVGLQTIWAPYDDDYYGIEDSIDIGVWNIDGAGNVLGASSTKTGLKFLGESGGNLAGVYGGAIRWNGTNQPGTTKVSQSDSLGSYDFITDAKAMFHGVNSRHLRFENLRLVADGPSSNNAYSCIHIEGNSQGVQCDNVIFRGGNGPQYRIGTRYDYANSVTYWGYGNSPYYVANVYDPVTAGGWDTRDHIHNHCEYQEGGMGWSQESQQAIECSINAPYFNQSNAVAICNIAINGGSLSIKEGSIVWCNNAATYCVRNFVGNAKLKVDSFHDETQGKAGPPLGFYQSSATAQSGIEITASRLETPGLINIRSGGGKFSFNDCELGQIRREYNSGQKCYLSVHNSDLEYINLTGDSTSNPENMFIQMTNIDRGSLTDSLFSGQQIYVGSVENVVPIEGIDSNYRESYTQYGNKLSYLSSDGRTKSEAGLLSFSSNVSSVLDSTATTIFTIDASATGRAYGVNFTAQTYKLAGGLGSANPSGRIESFNVMITVTSGGVIDAQISSAIGSTVSSQGTGSSPTAWSVVNAGSAVWVQLTQTSGVTHQCDVFGKLLGGNVFGNGADNKVVSLLANSTGVHDGAANAAVLTDTTKAWTVDEWVGYTLYNGTDGSSTTITSNTATTITGVLSGGTDDDWDVSDKYTILR